MILEENQDNMQELQVEPRKFLEPFLFLNKEELTKSLTKVDRAVILALVEKLIQFNTQYS